MKKLIMFLTVAIVLCMTIAPAMATAHTAPGTEDGDVLARYVYTPGEKRIQSYSGKRQICDYPKRRGSLCMGLRNV